MKNGAKVFIIIAALAVIISAGLYLYQTKVATKAGWKTMEGCVEKDGKEIKFQFLGKEEWQLVTENMGCGKDYPEAQTFGLKNQTVGDQLTDVSQITILLFDMKPSTFDQSAFEYFTVPKTDSTYLEFGRITMNSKDQKIGITDEEWESVKKSFKFE